MKIIIGPGVNQLQILDRNGKDITREIHAKSIIVNITAGELPTAFIECEIFGEIAELEVLESQVEATLRRHGIERIEKPDADLHSDA